MTPEEMRAQRRIYATSEAAIGSDADEAAMREAYKARDYEKQAVLIREAHARSKAAGIWFDKEYPR